MKPTRKSDLKRGLDNLDHLIAIGEACAEYWPNEKWRISSLRWLKGESAALHKEYDKL